MPHRQWRWKNTKYSDKKKKEVNLVKAGWLMKNNYVPLKSLITKLDNIFSRYKRLSALMPAGYIRCFTCGAFISFRETDNGHYIGREFMGTRYCEENTECQCHSCNRFAEGSKASFALNLIKKYGPGILERLDKLKNERKFFTSAELEELIVYYKAKVKKLEIYKLGH
jgi:hypothetical protein